jgi:hypothetical protein
MTQNDIYIVFKLFLNIFINLKIDNFIYWHTTIHYNYNKINFLKIQNLPLQSFKYKSFLFGTLIKNTTRARY